MIWSWFRKTPPGIIKTNYPNDVVELRKILQNGGYVVRADKIIEFWRWESEQFNDPWEDPGSFDKSRILEMFIDWLDKTKQAVVE